MMIFISSFFAKRLGPKVASFITTISIFALIPILLGFSYTHYYTTLIPLIPIYCAVFFYIRSNKINILAVILCVIMAFPLANYFVQSESNIVHYSKKLYSQSHPAKTSDVYSEFITVQNSLARKFPMKTKTAYTATTFRQLGFCKPTLCLALRYLFFRNGGRKCIPSSVVKLIK